MSAPVAVMVIFTDVTTIHECIIHVGLTEAAGNETLEFID